MDSYYDYWKTVPGWFTDNDRLIYAGAIARYGKSSKFAEIGVWKGRSFLSVLPLAKHLQYIQAVAIDTFMGSPGETDGEHKEALTLDIK